MQRIKAISDRDNPRVHTHVLAELIGLKSPRALDNTIGLNTGVTGLSLYLATKGIGKQFSKYIDEDCIRAICNYYTSECADGYKLDGAIAQLNEIEHNGFRSWFTKVTGIELEKPSELKAYGSAVKTLEQTIADLKTDKEHLKQQNRILESQLNKEGEQFNNLMFIAEEMAARINRTMGKQIYKISDGQINIFNRLEAIEKILNVTQPNDPENYVSELIPKPQKTVQQIVAEGISSDIGAVGRGLKNYLMKNGDSKPFTISAVMTRSTHQLRMLYDLRKDTMIKRFRDLVSIGILEKIETNRADSIRMKLCDGLTYRDVMPTIKAHFEIEDQY